MANSISVTAHDSLTWVQSFGNTQADEDPYAKSLRQAVALKLAVGMPLLVIGVGPVCKYIDRPLLALLPNVQPWLVGVHSEEGILAPVFDLHCWSHSGHHAHPAGTPMTRISEGSLQMALVCPEPPVVVRVVLDQPGPDQCAEVPAPLVPFLGESLHTDHGVAFAFDPFAWFRHVAGTIVRGA